MKTDLKNLIFGVVAALGLSAAGSASAVSILNFAGSATLEPPALGTATSITQFFAIDGDGNDVEDALRVQNTSGIFASLEPGTLFTANSTLNFGSGLDPLFSLGAFRFVLEDSMLVFQGEDFISLSGFGTIFGPDDFELPATVFFSTQGGAVNNRFSISGSVVTPEASVPEGGSAVLLLGLGLVGAGTLRRSWGKNCA